MGRGILKETGAMQAERESACSGLAVPAGSVSVVAHMVRYYPATKKAIKKERKKNF